MSWPTLMLAVAVGISGALVIRRDRLARGGRDGLWSWRDGAHDGDA